MNIIRSGWLHFSRPSQLPGFCNCTAKRKSSSLLYLSTDKCTLLLWRVTPRREVYQQSLKTLSKKIVKHHKRPGNFTFTLIVPDAFLIWILSKGNYRMSSLRFSCRTKATTSSLCGKKFGYLRKGEKKSLSYTSQIMAAQSIFYAVLSLSS